MCLTVLAVNRPKSTSARFWHFSRGVNHCSRGSNPQHPSKNPVNFYPVSNHLFLWTIVLKLMWMFSVWPGPTSRPVGGGTERSGGLAASGTEGERRGCHVEVEMREWGGWCSFRRTRGTQAQTQCQTAGNRKSTGKRTPQGCQRRQGEPQTPRRVGRPHHRSRTSKNCFLYIILYKNNPKINQICIAYFIFLTT